jgi:predicted ATPase
MVSGIPAELTPCYGREAEVDEVCGWLTSPVGRGQPGRRWVTLTGIGGIGKTRLLLQIADTLVGRQQYAHGVHLIELGEVDLGTVPRDRAHLPSAASQLAKECFFRPLGMINASPDEDGLETLVTQLADWECLLAVDCAEHVALPIALLLGTLLRRCPQVRVLVSSRDFLEAPGEQGLRVSTFPTPDPELPLQQFCAQPAVAILHDQARSIPGSRFLITENNRKLVAEVVERVDGIPLALVMVGSRLATMDVEDVLTGLNDDFALLTGGSPVTVTYHQTLEALLRSHWESLDEQQQRVWACCSVFVGGFDLDAAVSTCQAAGLQVDRVAVATLLHGLFLKSIIFIRDGRYRMLDTFRRWGESRLADPDRGVEEQVRMGHCRHYHNVIQQIAARWYSEDEDQLLRQAEAELLNLEQAMSWAAYREPRITVEITLAAMDCRLFYFAGDLGRGRRWLEFSFQHTPDDLLLAIMALLSWICMTMGDRKASRDWRDRAVAHVGDGEHPAVLTFAHANCLAFVEEDPDALAAFERARTQMSLPGAASPGAMVMRDLCAALAAAFLSAGASALEAARAHRVDAENRQAKWAWSWGLLVEAMGEVLHGSTKRAADCLRHAINLLVATQARWGLWCAAVTEYWRLARDGHFHQAAVVLGITEHWTTALGVNLPGLGGWKEHTDRTREIVQERLSTAAYESAYHRGRRIAANESAVSFLLDSVDDNHDAPHPMPLTPRVREAVVALVDTNGGKIAEIAERLHRSPRTVEEQLANARRVTHSDNLTGLALWALENLPECRKDPGESRIGSGTAE